MNKFNVGESVICSITVKDAAGALQDPVTTMQIKVEQIEPQYKSILAATNMTDDAGAGAYHYDVQTTSCTQGKCLVTYIATDGTRISIKTDTFGLE